MNRTVHGITIKAITNSGRKVSIIPWGVQENGKYKVTLYIDGLNGQHPRCCDDGYVHLIPDHEYNDAEKTEINEINKFHFANKIEFLTNVTEIISSTYITSKKTNKEILNQILKNIKNVFVESTWEDFWVNCGIKEKSPIWKRLQFKPKEIKRKIYFYNYKRVEEIVPLQSLHLGGTFQKFYSDKNWIKESEELSGSQICLA